MGDLRSAIEVADDTSFFTYRAVEDVMQFFLGEDEDRVKAWELLRSVLRVDRSFLKPLEETSKPARHGRLVSKTREEQVDLLQRAWKVVDRFVAFLHRGGRESLPAALFPPLK
jgi:hypothetical protein